MLHSLKSRAVWRKTSIIIMLLTMPLIQLGYSYYISWQILALLLLLQFVSVNSILKNLYLGILLLLAMELSVLLLPLQESLHYFLIAGRQFVLFFYTYLLLKKIPYMDDYFERSIERTITFILFLITGLVILQFIGYPNKLMFYIPANFYIAGQNTVPGQLNFIYSHVRPIGTFAEPSYLGFVIMSLYVVILTRFREGRLKWLLVFMIIICLVLAQTLAGLAAFFIISLIFWATRRGQKSTKIILSTTFGLALLVVAVYAFGIITISRTDRALFLDRLTNLSNDESAYGRIVAPFKLLQSAVSVNVFGLPLAELGKPNQIDPSDKLIGVDNGLLNLFITFGLTAFIILFLIIKNLWRDPLLVIYYFLASMFNGSLFSFDKVVVIGVVMILSGIRVRKLRHYEH